MSVAKKKKKKKIVYKLLEPRILGTAGLIPFKFDMQGNDTVGDLRHVFD